MKLNVYLETKKSLIDQALENFFVKNRPKKEGPFSLLFEAMHYSLFPGGKRLRPILTCATAEAVGGSTEDVLPIACAIEMIHTYSLIHDDLPPMDDDDYRRGKPSNHIQFGEAVAILAGDALVTEAFALLSQSRNHLKISPELLLEIIEDIGLACGSNGMIGGQFLDIKMKERADEDINYPELEFLYIRKTGNLILTSITSGAKALGADSKQIEALTQYGKNLGLAFQLVDDILDMHDNYRGPLDIRRPHTRAILSIDETRQRTMELASRAIETLKSFDKKADPLREIAHYVVERQQ
ncbi:MAG: polyprenyl synthetase family protein [Deltaproteobacteria bacterium]